MFLKIGSASSSQKKKKKNSRGCINLGDVIGENGLFVDGDWVESKDQDPNGEVRLLQLADVGIGNFLNKSSRFLTKEKAEKLRCTYLQEGDLLVKEIEVQKNIGSNFNIINIRD